MPPFRQSQHYPSPALKRAGKRHPRQPSRHDGTICRGAKQTGSGRREQEPQEQKLQGSQNERTSSWLLCDVLVLRDQPNRYPTGLGKQALV
jgi:hypothetical protein